MLFNACLIVQFMAKQTREIKIKKKNYLNFWPHFPSLFYPKNYIENRLQRNKNLYILEILSNICYSFIIFI